MLRTPHETGIVCTMPTHRRPTTIDPAEQAHFAALAAQWWNPDGPLGALHRYNPLRLAYIRQAAGIGLGRDLPGLRVLDLGCGGGVLSEALARCGAIVTGLDASAEAIAAAKAHADEGDLTIDYQCADIAELPKTGNFDMVIASEVIEHVADPAAFLAAACAQLRPGGVLVVSTFNRTLRSFLLGVVAAEHVLGLAPKGTHDWRKFLRPSDIAGLITVHGLTVKGVAGARYQLLTGRMVLAPHDTAVNYLLWAQKKGGRAAGTAAPRARRAPARTKSRRQ
jgi:2-polyprenyl-6-hydroxyphenyl methylase/3-demethylubiquinone-9 3-methyltransferase